MSVLLDKLFIVEERAGANQKESEMSENCPPRRRLLHPRLLTLLYIYFLRRWTPPLLSQLLNSLLNIKIYHYIYNCTCINIFIEKERPIIYFIFCRIKSAPSGFYCICMLLYSCLPHHHIKNHKEFLISVWLLNSLVWSVVSWEICMKLIMRKYIDKAYSAPKEGVATT